MSKAPQPETNVLTLNGVAVRVEEVGKVRTATCALCSVTRSCLGASITDTSGAGWADICIECFDRLLDEPRSEGCVLCGDPDPPQRKAQEIFVHGQADPRDGWPLCDGCRNTVLRDEKRVVEWCQRGVISR